MSESHTDDGPSSEGLLARRGAKSLLLTLLGEFVYPRGGAVWTSTVVRALETVEITERNARQALARLGDEGIVTAERHGRRTRWHLTDRGMRLLGSGSERIYSFGHRADAWDESWLLVICSIPESQRAIRHQFRTQLTFEGFGFLAPTIAVSPHADREKAANDILTDLGLADSALTFRSTSGSMTADETVLRTAWDLDALAAEYAGFIETFGSDGADDDTATERDEPRGSDHRESDYRESGHRESDHRGSDHRGSRHDGSSSRRSGSQGSDTDHAPAGDGPAALGTTLLLVDAWRRFPFADPELPTALLPEGWVGGRAQDVFDSRRRAYHDAALAWYDRLEADAG